MVDKATWSLQERVDEFNYKYPAIKMNRWKLAKLYKTMGIKRKVIVKRAGNPYKYNDELVENIT